DTFAEFQYSYHYGDSYIPYLHQEEPLKLACQHFIECIKTNSEPLTNGRRGLELVRILEAASASLKMNGAPVTFASSTRPPPAFAPSKKKRFLRLKHSPDEWRTSVAPAHNGTREAFGRSCPDCQRISQAANESPLS